nr:hypothetical protein [Mycobacterium asiaticum]
MTDKNRVPIGTVLRTSHDIADHEAADSSKLAAEYEIIGLAPEANATDLLPNGRQLVVDPALRMQTGLPVCRMRNTVEQVCGSIDAANHRRFTVNRWQGEPRDLGGPVYAVPDDKRAVLIGLVESARGSVLEAQSWPALMQQVHADTRSSGTQRAVRLVSHSQ